MRFIDGYNVWNLTNAADESGRGRDGQHGMCAEVRLPAGRPGGCLARNGGWGEQDTAGSRVKNKNLKTCRSSAGLKFETKPAERCWIREAAVSSAS